MEQRRPDREETEPGDERWTTSGPIRPVPGGQRIEDIELASHVAVGDASPLGLAAFAAALFTVSAVVAGWSPITDLVSAVPILIIFGGIAQFVAAMWSFRKGETFWATFQGVFGSWFAVLGFAILLGGGAGFSLGGNLQSAGLGFAVAMFAFIAAYLTLAATGISPVMVGVLGFLTVSLGLIAVAFFAGLNSANWALTAGGYAGIISALIAFYASATIVVNSALRREVLPY